jgi:lysyl-tRNA synthetase class 2
MSSDPSWKPNASLDIIRKRAAILWQIRDFMDRYDILEVDTPILSHFAVSDPYIQSLKTANVFEKETPLYMQTSPEFCMKRLLAAGTESIYQIAHVFRDEESGKRHQTEFTMLEWYRLGFDYYQLMDDVAELLIEVGLSQPGRMTYAEAFLETVQFNPHTADLKQLQETGGQHGWGNDSEDRHALLDYIFSEAVLKNIDNTQPLFIYDYPECMAALATIKEDSPRVAERFELFINNIEIANGFNELCDASEQKQRFESELESRKEQGLSSMPIDPHFIAALNSGLPKTAGVAVGIDRLLMALCGKDDIKEVITFSLDNN